MSELHDPVEIKPVLESASGRTPGSEDLLRHAAFQKLCLELPSLCSRF